MNKGDNIELTLSDELDGKPISPSHVSLAMLKKFLDDVTKFVKKDGDNSLNKVPVSLKEGSVAIAYSSDTKEAQEIAIDWDRLIHGREIDKVPAHRVEIFNKWQTEAKRSPKREYALKKRVNGKMVREAITKDTNLIVEEPALADVEDYVFGMVTDWGGQDSPNIHIKLENGKTLMISARHDQIKNEKENRVYHWQLLRVRAKMNIRTKERIAYSLISFEEYDPKFDGKEFDTFTKKGAEAWKDIDATEWVERQRGNIDD